MISTTRGLSAVSSTPRSAADGHPPASSAAPPYPDLAL
jgi:hypothetical protein